MNQKGLVPILIIVAILAIFLGGYLLGQQQTKLPGILSQPTTQSSPTPDPTANWKTYTSEKYGFSIKYPNDWSVRVTSAAADPYIYIDLNIKASWGESAGPEAGFPYTIAITEHKNTKKESFKDFVTKDLSEELKNNFTFQQEKIGSYTFYRTDKLPSAYGALNVYITEDGGRYISIDLIPYSLDDPPNNQDKVLPTFNQILSTFKFLP